MKLGRALMVFLAVLQALVPRAKWFATRRAARAIVALNVALKLPAQSYPYSLGSEGRALHALAFVPLSRVRSLPGSCSVGNAMISSFIRA